jgi:hypothetical protein
MHRPKSVWRSPLERSQLKIAHALPHSLRLRPVPSDSSIFLRRIVGVMFMGVNARCAHQARPPRRGGVDGRRDLDSDNPSPLRTTARRGCHRGQPSVTTGVQSPASRAGSNRGLATNIICSSGGRQPERASCHMGDADDGDRSDDHARPPVTSASRPRTRRTGRFHRPSRSALPP